MSIKLYFFASILLIFPNALCAQTPEQFHEKLLTLSEQSDFSGFTVGIVNRDSILYTEGFGYADKAKRIPYQPNHAQIVASVSKTWIGIAIMKCVERGELSLDSEINKILPYEVINPNFPEVPITVKHLVTHTSSITYTIPNHHKIVFEEAPELQEYNWLEKRIVRKMQKNQKVEMNRYLISHLSCKGLEYKAKNFGNYPPGSKYQYSNMASTLAASIVEIISKMPFADFCEINIIKPLQLKNASFYSANIDKGTIANQYFGKHQKLTPRYSHNFYPTGGLMISNEDLSLFLMDVINGYHGKGKLLSKSFYQQLLSPQFSDQDLPENFPKNESNHGVFWTYQNNYIGHTGGGLGTSVFMFFNKETGIGKIFITNCEMESNKELVAQFIKIWRTMDEFPLAN